MIAELFLQSLVERYGKHPVYTDGALWYVDACRSLDLPHIVYGDDLKSLMERFVQTLKDRTEGFDDYFPCRREACCLQHIKAWIKFYMLYYNLIRRHMTFETPPANETITPEFSTMKEIITERIKYHGLK